MLMKPEVSAGCHQTLSLVGGVWGRDYMAPTYSEETATEIAANGANPNIALPLVALHG